MVVNIKRNLLKLLSQEFLQIVPIDGNRRLEMGQIVEVECERYGKLGQAEVQGFYVCHVYELKETVLKLSDGHYGTQAMLMRDHGINSLRMVQVVRLSFKRRRDAAFQVLVEKELKNAGVEMVRQGEMFV